MYKRFNLLLILIFLFLSASNSIFAKADLNRNIKINSNLNSYQNDDFAAKHAKDLQNRLGLTNDQAAQVANILTGYKENVQNNNPDNQTMNNSNDPEQSANDSIMALLDSSQKAAFAQMQKEWWANVNQDIGNLNRTNQK
jgi:nitric oxide reductase large subunit